MFPPAGSGSRSLYMASLHKNFRIIRGFAVGFRYDSRPVQAEGTIIQKGMFSLQGRIDDVLVVPFHTYRTFLVVVAVADFGLAHVHIAVVPRQFMIGIDMIIEFGMCSDTRLLRRIVTIFSAVVRRSRLVIQLSFLASIGIQITSGKHYTQFVLKETVAVRQSCGQVGQWLFPCHVQIVGREIIHCHPVVFRFTHLFVGRLLDNGSVIERLKVAVEIHGVVAGRNIGCELSFGRSILHDQVHRTTDSVAFHVGGKRLGYLQSVEHFRGENIQWNETVLVVRTRNLYAIDQRIVVTLVHTTKNSVLAFTAAVTFDGHTRHTLYYVCYGNIR